jgi:hypothetical protein
MYYRLSNSQKKIARKVMDKGMDNHYHRGLSDVETIIQQWKNAKLDNHDAYMKLYQTVKKNDTNIARIYNDKGGSLWVGVIVSQLMDGVITVDDLSEFDEEVHNTILEWGGLLETWKKP